MAELKKEEKIIEIVNVSKIFDETAAVQDISFYVRKGEFITFLGPSGCGKTTTLRMIAGFDIPTSGKILLSGKDITNLPPNKRPVNTVFQRYALFPHYNIYDNIAFGLKLKKVPVTYMNDKGETYTKLQKLTRKEIDEKVRARSPSSIWKDLKNEAFLLCPAVSNSASPLRAPLSTNRKSFCSTNLSALST